MTNYRRDTMKCSTVSSKLMMTAVVASSTQSLRALRSLTELTLLVSIATGRWHICITAALFSFLILETDALCAAVTDNSVIVIANDEITVLAARRGLSHNPVSIDSNLEKLCHLFKRSLKGLEGAEKTKEVLSIEDVLGDHTIRLAKCANTHTSCVHLHGMKQTRHSRGTFCLQRSVKAEFVHVYCNESNLSLKVVAKADDFRSALRSPCLGNAA
ncbi:hypothetical protein GGS21DRAFT_284919 [Xylaria nigripes]|nr:hypothetical protein GGS21DRAFT_284919 [Xylaria nigripes]